MTVQEAIACLNLIKLPLHGEAGVREKAINMAIVSMEKQIPKSPALSGDGYSEGKLIYDTWECPNCGEQYEVDYDDYDYCPKCGQAINKAVFNGEEGGTSD